MRAYWSILKDSFREAMASRVLWVLLILISLVLLALAPFGYRETITIGLDQNAIREWPEFMDRIKTEGKKSRPSPARRIWSLLDKAAQERLEKHSVPEQGDAASAFEFIATIEVLTKALDEMLRRTDFYDREAWTDTQMVSPEGRELLEDSDELSDDERRRLNRLLLEAAFPDLVRASPPTSVVTTYFVLDVGSPSPIRARQFATQVSSSVATLNKYLVGMVGILAAILVTAPIIPRTFEPGSINLLLSKPISRPLLFLTKYLGACAFILINAAYLIGGMWLILGIRFGVWNSHLLVAIPVYVFLFAVYYSVSACAGAVWRSAMASIAVTILFGLLCTGLEWSKALLRNSVETRPKIVKVIPVPDALLSVNEMGMTSRWDDSEREWTEAFVSKDRHQMGPMLHFVPLEALNRPIGPVYDAANDRLLAVSRSMTTGMLMVTVGNREADWESMEGVGAPPGTFSLLRAPDGDILAIAVRDILRLEGDPLASEEPAPSSGEEVPSAGEGPFRSVGPEPSIVLRRPATAAMNDETGMFAVYSRGVIRVLGEDDDGKYEVRRERKLVDDEGERVVLAFGGTTVVVGLSDGTILALDADTLDERARFASDGSGPARFVVTSPGGQRFAVVYHSGRLSLLDAEKGSLAAADVVGQGDVSAAAFSAPDRLLVAYRSTRVAECRLGSGEVVRRYAPKLGLFERVYRYGVNPLYTIMPKHGELDNTVEYLLAASEAGRAEGEAKDLTLARQRLRPWTPVWSSLLFTAVVLALGSLYIQRREF